MSEYRGLPVDRLSLNFVIIVVLLLIPFLILLFGASFWHKGTSSLRFLDINIMLDSETINDSTPQTKTSNQKM